MTIHFTVLRKGVPYECQIEDVDADLLKEKWWIWWQKQSNTPYLQHPHPKLATVRMHVIIMARVLGRPLADKEFVDHRNGNGLDNTRSNLRVATHSQNLANAKVNKTNKLGVKGVTAWRGGYMARIHVNNKQIFLGIHPTIELASEAYMAAAREAYGEFASDGNRPID